MHLTSNQDNGGSNPPIVKTHFLKGESYEIRSPVFVKSSGVYNFSSYHLKGCMSNKPEVGLDIIPNLGLYAYNAFSYTCSF